MVVELLDFLDKCAYICLIQIKIKKNMKSKLQTLIELIESSKEDHAPRTWMEYKAQVENKARAKWLSRFMTKDEPMKLDNLKLVHRNPKSGVEKLLK